MDMNTTSVAPIISASIINKRKREKEKEYKTKTKKFKEVLADFNEPAIIYESSKGAELPYSVTYSRPIFIKN